MKEMKFIKELEVKFNKTRPDHFKIFDDIYTHGRKLVYCHWLTDKDTVSIDYQIIDNEVTQITAS